MTSSTILAGHARLYETRIISASQPSSIRARCRTPRSRPRTAASSTYCVLEDDEIICAISESRGIAPTVGLAFINIATCEAVLCQLADTQTFAKTCHKVGVFYPSEILFSKTAVVTKLIPILQENLAHDNHDIYFTPLNRKYWSESSGIDYLQQFAFSADLESLKSALSSNYFACCSFAAVMQYVENELAVTFVRHSLRVKFETSEGALMIDLPSIRCLELVQNLQNVKSKDCLYGVLNQTLTRMGGRLLKSNLLQPTTDSRKIKQRLEAVEELTKNQALFHAVREALKGFMDTDRILAQLITIPIKYNLQHMEQAVNHILMFKTFVNSVQPVFQALADVSCHGLRQVRDLCAPHIYAEVKDLIDYATNPDIGYSSKPMDLRNQRVYAIKAGVSAYLDLARRAYSKCNEDTLEMVEKLKEEIGVSLEVKFDAARQYYLRIRTSELEEAKLPNIFINVCRQKNFIECQTLNLVKMNQKIKEAHNEVINISDHSICELIKSVRSAIYPLFKISEAVALLDMFSAFALVAVTQEYVKPELTTATLAIKDGRHPLHEKIQQEKRKGLRYVPNDVYATRQNRFQIITGSNMSGKSTHIRMISLLSVMVQIGSFVPAQYASFPIIYQLFARAATDDSMNANISTFASEMNGMASILHNVESSRSLIVVDELGRGTSTLDGMSIAIAISEALIENGAYVWFVTHFRDLPRILAQRAGVISLHMASEISEDFSRTRMYYRISEGQEAQKLCGLALAQVFSFPEGMLKTAFDIAEKLHQRNEQKKMNVQALAAAKRRILILNLRESIMQAKEKACTNDAAYDANALLIWLRKLKEEFTVRMNAIDAEVEAAEAEHTTTGLRLVDNGESDDNVDINSLEWSTSKSCTTPQNSSPTQIRQIQGLRQMPAQFYTSTKSTSRMITGHENLANDPIVLDENSSIADY